MCAASIHDVLEMKPSAVMVLLVKGLRRLYGPGSREANPKPDLYTVYVEEIIFKYRRQLLKEGMHCW